MSETAPLNQPRSKTDLFVSFTLLALQGFGGVLAVGAARLRRSFPYVVEGREVDPKKHVNQLVLN